jgi:hypothetical protein
VRLDKDKTPRGASQEAILSKGLNLLHLRDFTRSRFGDEAWHHVLARLKPEARDILFGRLLPSGWYPYGAYVEALKIVVERHLGGNIQRAAEIGAYDLEASLNTVYRALYRIGTPSFIIRMSAHLWRSYFNVGRMVIEKAGRGFATARIEDFLPHEEVCCWDIQGAMIRGLELSGASSVEGTHTECPLKGDAVMRYEANWIEGA